MTTMKINGRLVKARKGEYLLSVCRRMGIDIPALCHHEAVEPSGACRLCVVEITKPRWDGWSKLVTSCLYPVEEGLEVRTDSPRVRKMRKEVLELLLARSPDAKPVVELAREYGILEPRYTLAEVSDNCILCGICTRVCQDLVTGAISRVNRGIDKKVDTPFAEVSEDCIGCLACARSCPTDAIEFKEDGLERTIWNKTFDLVPCTECGAPTVTREQADWISKKEGLSREDLFVCDKCKAKRTARAYEKLAW